MKLKSFVKVWFLTFLSIGSLSALSAPVQPDYAIFEKQKYLFDIPVELSMELEFENWQISGSVQTSRFKFKSLDNGYATGTIVRPIAEGKFPVILTMYGLFHKPTYSLNPGINFSNQTNAIYVAFDPPVHRDDRTNNIVAGVLSYSPGQQRDEQIQLIKDLRILISLLSDLSYVESGQIGFYGYSYGAAMGGILAAVEPRLKALVLAAGTGGRYSLRPTDPMYEIDPIHYVVHVINTPILLQNGENDQTVKTDAASLYQQSVSSEHKELRWYPTGHFLSCKATMDAIEWLSNYIELNNHDNYQCGRLPIF